MSRSGDPSMPTRRWFLRGFGGAMVSLPLLEACRGPSLGSERAALVEHPARRFIALMAPDGVVPEYWFPPSGGETDFVLGRHLQLLQPHRDRVMLFRGIDNVAARTYDHKNGHIEGVTSMLTGRPPTPINMEANQWTGSGVSIDQLIAEHQLASGYLPKVSSIHLGEEGAGGYSTLSYSGPSQAVDTIGPSQLFAQLFEDSNQTTEALARARERRKSILDGTREDYGKLATKVSGEDLNRVNAHLDAVRAIEQRLDNVAVCARPNLALMPADDDVRRTLYYDLLVAAMTCDATRVATVSFHHSGGGGPQLPFVGVFEDIHELSHQIVGGGIDGPAHIAFDKYHQWFTGKTRYLVEKMKSVTLPDGHTLFDETVIFQGSEIAFNHDHPNMPYLVIAGSRTPLRTGRFVQVPPATPHNHLLVSIAHAFGLELGSFGAPAIRAGDLDAVMV